MRNVDADSRWRHVGPRENDRPYAASPDRMPSTAKLLALARGSKSYSIRARGNRKSATCRA